MQCVFAICHELSIFCKIIQLIYSNSSADLYSHNTLFELPVTSDVCRRGCVPKAVGSLSAEIIPDV